MDAFQNCWANEASCDEGLSRETADMRAYHAWLGESAGKAPFATTVIVHNLVTSTIAPEYVRGEQRFACVGDAASAIPKEMLDGEFSPAMPALPSGVFLPGIGEHYLIPGGC